MSELATSTLAQIGVLFAFLTLGIFALLCVLLRPRVRLEKRLTDSEASGSPHFDWSVLGERLKAVARPVGQMVPRPPGDLSKEEKQLVQAGFRNRDAFTIFWGARLLLALGALSLTVATGLFWHHILLSLLTALFVGLILPGVWLGWRIRKRQRRIEWGLPDFMDLAVVCVEAGLGLDQTIQRVGCEISLPHPDLGDELMLYGLEVNAGRTRAEALRNLAERTGLDELKSFAAVLIQADRFGTSVGQTLRVYADDLRIKRRQKAEEIAAKLPVKMVFPLILFIFPAILVVLGGPAMLAIFRTLIGSFGGVQ